MDPPGLILLRLMLHSCLRRSAVVLFGGRLDRLRLLYISVDSCSSVWSICDYSIAGAIGMAIRQGTIRLCFWVCSDHGRTGLRNRRRGRLFYFLSFWGFVQCRSLRVRLIGWPASGHFVFKWTFGSRWRRPSRRRGRHCGCLSMILNEGRTRGEARRMHFFWY